MQSCKQIPIWQERTRTLQFLPQHTLNIHIPSLNVTFSDDRYQILSSIPSSPFLDSASRCSFSSHQSDVNSSTNYNNSGRSNSIKSRNNKPNNYSSNLSLQQNSLCGVQTEEFEEGSSFLSHYSVVFDRKYGRVVGVPVAIQGCLPLDRKYYLFILDQSNRLKPLKVGQLDLIQSLTKHLKNEQKDLLEDGDTKLQPIAKNGCQFVVNNSHELYVIGYKPIHTFQITSPLWKFSLHQQHWAEVLLKDREGNKVFYQGAHLEYKTPKANCDQKWMFLVGKALLTIQKDRIIGRSIQTNLKCKQSSIPMPTTHKNHPLCNPQTDSYVQCSYTSIDKKPSVLLLVHQKKNCAPILICISYKEVERVGEERKNESKQRQRQRQGSKKKGNFQVRSMTEENKDDSSMSIYLYIQSKRADHGFIQISRLDCGVLLNRRQSLLSQSVQIVENQLISRYDEISPTKQPIQMLANLKQISFMQVVESLTPGAHQSMSSTGGTKKSIDQNWKQQSRKIQTLQLFKRATINSVSTSTHLQISFQIYFIKLNQLQKLKLIEPNRPLHYYEKSKEYCDLVFIADGKQAYCNRQLFEQYSPKFKKLYSNSTNSKLDSGSLTYTKLQNVKLSAIYFLIKHIYYQFQLGFEGLDQDMILDLMVLAQKFQVSEMQALCQAQIIITVENFVKLYDYFRNAETTKFKDEFLKFFILRSQKIIPNMPIGKLEELIRIIYTPDCPHTNICYIKSKIDKYELTDSDEKKELNKSVNFRGIVKNDEIHVNVCLKCKCLVNFQGMNQNEKNRKSNSRACSLSNLGHKKKDNHSN